MAEYVVGDIQGCYPELVALLNKVNFNPSQDTLYCVGDLIARGSNSLATLQLLSKFENAVKVTLGNHDLHFLACHFNLKTPNPKDKLNELFNAPERSAFVEFYQNQTLAIWLAKHNTFISHAGLSPELALTDCLALARNAEKILRSDQLPYYLGQMYGNKINTRNSIVDSETEFTYTVNALTRMRYVDKQGKLDFKHKSSENLSVLGLFPWFDVNSANHRPHTILFGHWAALEGTTNLANVIALDTGCVWGGKLTLIELRSGKLVSVKSQ